MGQGRVKRHIQAACMDTNPHTLTLVCTHACAHINTGSEVCSRVSAYPGLPIGSWPVTRLRQAQQPLGEAIMEQCKGSKASSAPGSV
jgi:hypothetical protein